MLYISCLEGEEQKREKQRHLYQLLNELLSYLYCGFEESNAIDTALAVVKAFIPDGNYLDYSDNLAHLYLKKAKVLVDGEKAEEANEALREAFRNAAAFDRIEGKYTFTAPLFDHLTFDRNDWCVTGQTTTEEDIKRLLKMPRYASLNTLDVCKELLEK